MWATIDTVDREKEEDDDADLYWGGKMYSRSGRYAPWYANLILAVLIEQKCQVRQGLKAGPRSSGIPRTPTIEPDTVHILPICSGVDSQSAIHCNSNNT